MPRARLGSGSWRFEDDALARLRDKIANGRKTLGEVYGPPLHGIKTGLNEAFVIDTPTRDRLVKADPKSAELLKPFLRGENIKRWRVEPEGLWLINTPKGKVDIDAYPAIRDWLLPFKPELEKRATKQEWWELQQAQLAYQPRNGNGIKLSIRSSLRSPTLLPLRTTVRYLLSNKCFFLPTLTAFSAFRKLCISFQLNSIANVNGVGSVKVKRSQRFYQRPANGREAYRVARANTDALATPCVPIGDVPSQPRPALVVASSLVRLEPGTTPIPRAFRDPIETVRSIATCLDHARVGAATKLTDKLEDAGMSARDRRLPATK